MTLREQSAVTVTDFSKVIATGTARDRDNRELRRSHRALLSTLLADLSMNNYIGKYLTDINQPNKLWTYVDDILIFD